MSTNKNMFNSENSMSFDCNLFIEINKISNLLKKYYPQHNLYSIIKDYDVKFPNIQLVDLINKIKCDFPLINSDYCPNNIIDNSTFTKEESINLQWLTGC